MSYKSLIINPGSTSTKIGVFEDETLLFEETLRHSTEEIAQYASIVDQKDFRKNIIVNLLKEKNFDMKELSVVVGRGGMLKPIPGGTYKVTDDLLNDLRIGKQGQHASNLGGILAREIGDELGVPSFIVDPVVVDELAPVARYSGCPELPRTSVFHALNQKAVAKRYAKESGQKYEDLNLIVVHMGGGVSVGAHKNGKVVDVFNALDGDGAFSPERAGAVPVGALVKMCFSGKYSEKEVYKKLALFLKEKQGGADHKGVSVNCMPVGYFKKDAGLKLAMSFANEKKKTLLIDLVKEPEGKEAGNSISRYVLGDESRPVPTTQNSYLDVLCRDVAEEKNFDVVMNERFASYVKEMQDTYEYIVINSPNVAESADAFAAGKLCDKNFVVCARGGVNNETLYRLKNEAAVQGIVLEGVLVYEL